MKKSFKPGDKVSYGVTPGTLLGIYNVTKSLFLSDYPRENFFTFSELRQSEQGSRDVFFFFVKEYFGNCLSETAKKTLKQRRFFPVLLSDIKHTEREWKPNPKTEFGQMVRKRHLYLTMARYYVRCNMPDVKIQGVCEKIEELQLKIEANPYHVTSHTRNNC